MEELRKQGKLSEEIRRM